MIAFVSGTIRLIRKESVVVDVGGIGYEVYVPRPFQYLAGQPVFLYTFQQFREDGQFLYGFDQEPDLEVFQKLLSVRGIGCRSALNILAVSSAKSIVEAVEEGDAKALKALPGIGQKTANQIILDLKGKLVLPETPERLESDDPLWNETLDALEALGYKSAAIASVRKEILSESPFDSVQSMLRRALMLLSKGS